MNNKIISKSERSITNTVIIFIGIILFSFFIFLLYNNLQPKNDYEKNLKVIGFFVLTLIILYCIFYLLNQKRIYVYENYFEIKKLLQTRKYHFSEITTHFFEYLEGKYNSWTKYYLILKTGEKITLIDSEYSNFDNFYSKIKQRVKENKELNTKLSQPKFLEYSIICGIISCLIFYFSSYFYDFKKIENKDFVYITSKLKKEITIVKGSKGKKHFEIHLINQPNFEFKISGNSYDGVSDYNQFLNTFKTGDNIIIGIEKGEYEKKISKTQSLNILDKYLNYSKIQVKQVKNIKNKFLIDLEEVNRLKIQSNYIGIGMFSLLGLLCLYLTYGNYIAYVKSNSQTRNKNHT